MYLEHHLESQDIMYYKRYADDLFIIYDQTKINEDPIHDIINNTDEHLEFKITKEENHITNSLDFTIQRKHNEFELSIYWKPTFIDIALHFTSNHPYRHKMSGFYFYINRIPTYSVRNMHLNRNGIWLSLYLETMDFRFI